MSRKVKNPRVALLRQHYKALGIYDGWPICKAHQLCETLQCTMEELAAMCGVFTRGTTAAWERAGKVPAPVAVSMHLIRAAISQAEGMYQLACIPIELMEQDHG